MKKFTGLGIQKKTVMILLGTFLASLFLCGIVFAYVYNHMQSTQRKALVTETNKEVQDNMTSYFEKVDELSYNVAYSEWMQKVFDKGLSNYERQKRINEARNVMNTLSFLNSDVQFSIFMLDKTRFNSNAWFIANPTFQVEEQEWFPQLKENKKYVWSGEKQPVYYKNKDWCIMPYYIVNNYNSLDLAAYLSVHISLETFTQNVITQNGYGGCQLSLLDMKGTYIYTEMSDAMQQEVENMKDEATQEVMDSRKYTVLKSKIKIGETPYYLLSVLENSTVIPANSNIWLIFAGIVSLMAVILLIAAVGISKYITSPIIRCRDAMTAIVNNNLGIRVENPYKDEFGEMLESFNEMSGSIYELIEVNKNISVLQKEAEYKLLERQINPHFLFNTMELINSLIMNGEGENARKVCEALGELYHYNLRQEKFISLEAEMEYTKKYLYLMTYKVHNLSFYYDCDEQLKNQKILKVVLQPLVENSIRHGCKDGYRDYCITLIAKKLGTPAIQLVVMDNGSGMEEETLHRIRADIAGIRENPEVKLEGDKHIGIKNVVQRMALEYGTEFEIQIDSKINFGVRIELTIRGGI